MAATLTQERFATPEWIFERKFDGIRILAFKKGASVRLLSRNRLPQNHHYPAIAEAIAQLPVDNLVLDGEAVGGLHVFDILWLNGQNTTALALDQRRALLAQLPLKAPLHRVPEIQDAEPWVRACKEGWEGVIAKRRDSIYEHKRSRSWLKMKCEITQEFVIGGFTDPQRSRVGLGALLIGFFENSEFVFAGKVGTGLDNKGLIGLRARLDQLEIPSAPFTKGTGLPRVRAHWVRPDITVKVSFMEWTNHGKLRHPRLVL